MTDQNETIGAEAWVTIRVDENRDGSQEITVVDSGGMEVPDGEYLFVRARHPWRGRKLKPHLAAMVERVMTDAEEYVLTQKERIASIHDPAMKQGLINDFKKEGW